MSAFIPGPPPFTVSVTVAQVPGAPSISRWKSVPYPSCASDAGIAASSIHQNFRLPENRLARDLDRARHRDPVIQRNGWVDRRHVAVEHPDAVIGGAGDARHVERPGREC